MSSNTRGAATGGNCEDLVGTIYDSGSPPAGCLSADGWIDVPTFYDCAGKLVIVLPSISAVEGQAFTSDAPDLASCTRVS